MHESKRTPHLGALQIPGEIRDRFSLSETIGRRNGRTGRLLTNIEGGDHR